MKFEIDASVVDAVKHEDVQPLHVAYCVNWQLYLTDSVIPHLELKQASIVRTTYQH